jgi:ubiquinone/menaquinone biosynthesis C-methylase UbiE
LSGDGRRLSIPVADASFDAALASLFIAYVSNPQAVLHEISRTLRPGGRLVVSGLRKDADVSKLFIDAVSEIAAGGGIRRIPGAEALDLQRACGDFLNDASRLLDLEELGVFEFRDKIELVDLVESAGFRVDRVSTAFGDPPQSIIVVARKDK